MVFRRVGSVIVSFVQGTVGEGVSLPLDREVSGLSLVLAPLS